MAWWLKFRFEETQWLRMDAETTIRLPLDARYLDCEIHKDLPKYRLTFAHRRKCPEKCRRSFTLLEKDEKRVKPASYKEIAELKCPWHNQDFVLYEKIA